ncbi:hypothetical protein EV359DRAFT_65163 [Lentinula novae-zelandiae]|nr:hypothetical protein EV359DRAFT_65163 [Lentinula novae-zelandiae]
MIILSVAVVQVLDLSTSFYISTPSGKGDSRFVLRLLALTKVRVPPRSQQLATPTLSLKKRRCLSFNSSALTILWDPSSRRYWVQHYAGLTMDKILLSIFAMLLYGPLKSACLIFDVSSPVLNDTNLEFMVNFTRNSTDPSEWGVWAFVEKFQDNTLSPDFLDLVPVMVYNQSQLSGILLLHPNLVETNVTLQAFTFNSTKTPAFESTSPCGSNRTIGAVSGGSSTHTNVIVGATIGSFAFALLTLALLTIWLRRRRRIAPSEFFGDKMVRAPYSYSEGFGLKHHSNDGAENARS